MTSRYSPYKIKPHGGSLIVSHYQKLPMAVEHARELVASKDYESVDIVARGSNILLATVDKDGLHSAKATELSKVDDVYAHLTPEYIRAAWGEGYPVDRTGADAGYYVDPARGGPSLRTYHERMFDATAKFADEKSTRRLKRR